MIPISRPERARRVIPLALLVALALVGPGCGRRGELEPAAGASPAQKPADDSNGDPQIRKKIPPITSPKTPFVLDPLL